MRLYQQLVLFMLAATVLPLALLGFWLLRESERELGLRIAAEQRAQAREAAASSGKALLDSVEAIARSAEMIDWARASATEVRGGLSLLYQQSQSIAAVVLLSAQGSVVEGPVYLREGEGGHPGFDPRAGLSALAKAIPLASLQAGTKGQAALSPAYRHSLGKMAAVAVAVKLSDLEDSSFAVGELGLGTVDALLANRATMDVGRIDLVDGEGRVMASSESGGVLGSLEPAIWTEVQSRVEGERPESFGVKLQERLLVAAASVPGQLGLYTVVSLPERVALAPVRRMRRTVLGALGGALLVLLVLGALFTRKLASRVAAVSDGAEAFAKGDLSRRIPVTGSDELTELSETFNNMGAELETSRAKLLRWNDELTLKVDEATSELRAAQAQLVEAQKLAAVGQLGAGVAHEINNPLAGILGNTQLLLLDRTETDGDFQTLRKIEQMAKRCKEITQNLLRFSQQRDRPELRATDLNAVVRDAFSLTNSQTQGDGITLVPRLAPGALMVRGDPGHLSQVVLALLSNARTAMAKSTPKQLTVTTRDEGGHAVVEVRDTGKGIKPEHLPRIFEPFFTTKDVWSNVGLGLSVAYRILNEHQGKIDVATEVGKGTTFTLQLPRPGTVPAGKQPPPAPRPPPTTGALG
ncbi:MAG: ATP-binding protein [Myxococcota bacterium]|nr:ATP-binding protein [Myxococcota bacterium]